MQVAPDSIIIRRRIRQELGDLGPLMESLRRYGQLSPILINRRGELIAGHRRLEAVRRLGWRSIEAIVIDRESDAEKLEIELEENIQRSNLSSQEISDAFIRLERLRRGGLFRWIIELLRRLLRRIFSLFR